MNWSWTIEDGFYAMRVHPLPPGLDDLVFVGRGLRARAASSPEKTVRLEQVHGTKVSWATEPGRLPACDAVRSKTPDLPLTVRTADCLSVVLVAPGEGVAVIHAGWRGLVGGILEAATATFGNPGDLHAVLGPVIGPCCFEVGPEVAERFPRSLVVPGRREKPHVDLPGDARRRLTEGGVPETAILGDPPCTRCHQHLFYSHRGSGGDGRRNVTVARYRPE